MTLPIIVGRTAVGGTLYAAFAPRPAGAPPRRGIVAHSADVALLAPFDSIDAAAAEIERLSGAAGPEGPSI